MVTDLLRFTFSSPLTRSQVDALAAATGMRIGDIDNPYKDTPGKGRFAGNVFIFLGRDKQDGGWYISAFSHDLTGADLPAVAVVRHRLRILMNSIAAQWEDKSADLVATSDSDDPDEGVGTAQRTVSLGKGQRGEAVTRPQV